MGLTVLSFLLVLSVLVLAHEIGHFVAARRAGIRVQEFGFGIPPRLFGFRRGGTLFSVNLLPLGGFVRMKGENAAPDEPDSFSSKSRARRALVLVAGAGMNLILAPLLFAGAFMIGDTIPCDSCQEIEIYAVWPDSPAKGAGLRAGDVLIRMDGEAVVQVETVRAAVQRTLGQQLAITLERDDEELTVTAIPRLNPPAQQGPLGISLGPPLQTIRRSPWEAVPMGVQRTGEIMGLLVRGLVMIVSGQLAADVAGPVGMARLTGQAAEAGLTQLLHFTGFLSLNLAILNMLPVPGLDGARLAFVGLEGLRGGRRVNPATEGVIHMVGLMLIIMLMVYVSYQDILQIVR